LGLPEGSGEKIKEGSGDDRFHSVRVSKEGERECRRAQDESFEGQYEHTEGAKGTKTG